MSCVFVFIIILLSSPEPLAALGNGGPDLGDCATDVLGAKDGGAGHDGVGAPRRALAGV
jgi:hypothetical protein